MPIAETGFSARLNAACDQAGIKSGRGRVADLHRRFKRYTGEQISLETIRRWLRGESMATMRHATNLADMLGVSTEYLLSSLPSGDDGQPLRHRVPLLKGRQLSDPQGAIEMEQYETTVETTLQARRSRFAVIQQGDSMAGKIEDQDKVIVDYQVTPKPGNYVVAERDGAWMIRKLVEEGGELLLRPANDSYPIRSADDYAINAVVCQAVTEFLDVDE